MQVENGCAETAENAFVPQKEDSATETADAVTDWEKEYAALEHRYAQLQEKSILEKISHETGCTDPEYLEFCARRQGITVLDPDALRRFARELASTSPGCFNARIIPGSSAGNNSASASPAGNQREAFTGDRISLIALSIDSAPDAVSR